MRSPLLHVRIMLAVTLALCACSRTQPITLAEEAAQLQTWRQERVASLTSDHGWLTLVGLYWLKPGTQSFGRDASNTWALAHDALPAHAGDFVVDAQQVRFISSGQTPVLHDQAPITDIVMASDATGAPTVLSIGSLRFHVIERVGQLGVRVRDSEHPARQQFAGLDYFPIDLSWHVTAQWLPYAPPKQVPIVNILGMTEPLPALGALQFKHGANTLRLDAILEAPDDNELMVMFNDSTNGRSSYGAGRYLSIARPAPGQLTVDVDFNKAYNPPCAFTEFATCPLPPKQNRLSIPVEAGEQQYRAASH